MADNITDNDTNIICTLTRHYWELPESTKQDDWKPRILHNEANVRKVRYLLRKNEIERLNETTSGLPEIHPSKQGGWMILLTTLALTEIKETTGHKSKGVAPQN